MILSIKKFHHFKPSFGYGLDTYSEIGYHYGKYDIAYNNKDFCYEFEYLKKKNFHVAVYFPEEYEGQRSILHMSIIDVIFTINDKSYKMEW